MHPINTRLVTLDGFKVGNALITGHLIRDGVKYYKVTTDYGNGMALTPNELAAMFVTNGVADHNHKYFV